MLERLLSMLGAGGVHTPDELASRLGVSEGLVEQMLADLSRLGYLRRVTSSTCQTLPNGHSAFCADCSLASTCAVGGPGSQVWVLTDKVFRGARNSIR